MPQTASSRKGLAAATAAERATAAILAGLLGLFMLFGVGFANGEVVHSAAHDSRHSIAFPCH